MSPSTASPTRVAASPSPEAGAPTCPAAIEALTVRYGRVTALDDVSLAVAKGQVYALLGRNGAGKTSLVRCLLGLARPHRGRALLFGEDAWRNRARAMLRVGVVPEEPDAPPELTSAELAALCARLHPRFDAPGTAGRCRRLGIPERVPFGRLSKGQKAQVMLALALGHAPELLVLDDPTLGLDPLARRAFHEELVGELAERDTAVLLTSHDLEGVERVATRIGILAGARLVLDEPLEELKARYRTLRLPGDASRTAEQVARMLAPLGVAAVERASFGAQAVASRFDPEAFARLTSPPAEPALAAIEAEAMSLEDIFAVVATTTRGGAA